jgi:hypothetical protein
MGQQEPESGARCLDELAHGLGLVATQIVHDDDVGLSVATSCCSTSVRKLWPLIGPSKTILAGSSRRRHDRQRWRRRATSARACSKANIVFLKRRPSRRRNRQIASCEIAIRRAASSAFNPCSVRLGVCANRSAMKLRCGSSTRLWRPPIWAGATEPVARRRCAHFTADDTEPGSHPTACLAGKNRCNRALAQIIRKRSDHRYWPPPSQHLESQSAVQGNPERFNQMRKRSRTPKAALSGSDNKAPGFAGGYLLKTKEICSDHSRSNSSAVRSRRDSYRNASARSFVLAAASGRRIPSPACSTAFVVEASPLCRD